MESDKPIMVFGYDIRKIPCFRDCFLYGVSSGVASGLGVFLFTSRPTFSMHCGFATYLAVGVGYWVTCRVKYVNDLFRSSQLQKVMENSIQLKGRQEIDEDYVNSKLEDV